MKKLLLVLCSPLLFISCNPTFYQLVEINSEEIKTDGNSANLSNQDIAVIFDFWANEGSTSYDIINISDQTIYIKHDECQLIKNGLAIDYYDNSEYTSSRSILKSKKSGRSTSRNQSAQTSNIYGSSSINTAIGAAASVLTTTTNRSVENSSSTTTTISNSSSSMKKDKKVFVIPSNSYKKIFGYSLQNFRFYDCDVKGFPSNKKSNLENGISFNKENTPLEFRIFITYSFDEDFTDKRIFETTAYVSRFSNWSSEKFMKEERYKECEGNGFFSYRNTTELFSPLRYYKRYNKYTTKRSHN
tara:strand:- start:55 stop:957 length:903 start_codon:yes stop_codon:yes gene_type:complete